MKKILLDSNILIYSDTIDSPFYIKCNKIIEDGIGGLVEIYISQRSLLEYYRVMTSSSFNLDIELVLENIDFLLQTFNILYDNLDTTLGTFKLASINSARSGKIFDYNLAALAIQNDIDILYTKNLKDFPKVKNFEVIDPTI